MPELPLPLFTTKMSDPFDAAPWATSTPEMRALFTVTPAVVYAPMVLVGFPFATKMSGPKELIWCTLFNPVMSAAFTVAPAVVYSPMVLPPISINRSEPESVRLPGSLSPVISEAFTVAPDVV